MLFLVCAVLSFAYGVKTLRISLTHLIRIKRKARSLTFQPRGVTTWCYIGIIISAIFISMFIISDILESVAKVTERRRFDRHTN